MRPAEAIHRPRPASPLVAKLELFAALSYDDKLALERLARGKIRRLDAREDIVREGDTPGHVYLILSGWACRYKQLEDGRRQIIGYFLPGDFCDLRIFILKSMDHSIATVTPVQFAEIPRETILDMTDNGSRLARALWWSALVAEAVEREWIVNLGQRTAFERMGHLLCELFTRQRAIGLTTGSRCELPLTQTELAETIGLSAVHVNRTLQELRAQGLILLQGKILTMLDLPRLERISLFNPNYLHLDREGRDLNANDV